MAATAPSPQAHRRVRLLALLPPGESEFDASEPGGDEPTGEAVADDEAEGGDGEPADSIAIAVANFPPSAEPWTGVGSPGQFLWSAVFDALTVIDEDGTPQPALAESWESIDELTWQFTLRDGVEFHNGSALTADDVVGTFELLLSEEGAASYGSSIGNYNFIDTVTAVDDATIEFSTSSPSPLLPAAISIAYIVPIDYFNEVGASTFATEPIGTGPYQSAEWGSDRVEMEVYDASWRTAQVPSIEFVNLNDPAAP